MTRAIDVAKILHLNGGELVGKTRLQKSFYFLEKIGLGFGFDFQYHHYGPYSEELTTATQDAIALGLVKQEKRVGSQSQPYSAFRLMADVTEEPIDAARSRILKILAGQDAITLELAATADFLEVAGYDDPWAETVVRKSSKASAERVVKAKTLLSDLSV
ncbi:hypothetical protein MesoLj113a_50340 [Mesorhizobium sp. 113-1-2]|uniref:hypothetical protein n=1 Tax=Mesorhizobium sp. 113-1-2 TaxID=2744515 RepID=UPI00192950DF|nr:hypothetical protein [Mesorhizobium sp. 113-1-2]BCG73876.1 hypothetical protein MesoLj113a_50340 [Mesorhizobium sp. 113-1-2]